MPSMFASKRPWNQPPGAGGHSHLVALPLDVLFEVCSFLPVPDVLVLSHAAKGLELDDGRGSRVWALLARREGVPLRAGKSQRSAGRPKSTFLAAWARHRAWVAEVSDAAVARGRAIFSGADAHHRRPDAPRLLASLLTPGVDVDHRHRDPKLEGCTLVNSATRWGRRRVVRALVAERGADWTLGDVGGFHCLMTAAWFGDAELVAFFLAHGRCTAAVLTAAGTYRGAGPLTAAEWAERQGHAAVAVAIRRAEKRLQQSAAAAAAAAAATATSAGVWDASCAGGAGGAGGAGDVGGRGSEIAATASGDNSAPFPWAPAWGASWTRTAGGDEVTLDAAAACDLGARAYATTGVAPRRPLTFAEALAAQFARELEARGGPEVSSLATR